MGREAIGDPAKQKAPFVGFFGDQEDDWLRIPHGENRVPIFG